MRGCSSTKEASMAQVSLLIVLFDSYIRDLEEDALVDEGAARVLEGSDGDPDKVLEKVRQNLQLDLDIKSIEDPPRTRK